MSLFFFRIKLFILLSYVKLKGKVINFWKQLWFNRDKSTSEASSIDEVSEITLIEPQEYSSLFLNNSSTSPVYMSRVTLLKIMNALPEDYVIPSPVTNQLMKDELGKYHQEQIDEQIIERIQQQLPQNYTLLNPFVFNNYPINSFVDNLNYITNHEAEQQITNNLPSDYKFN